MDRKFENKAAIRSESGGFQLSGEGRSASVYGQDAQTTSQSYRVVRGEQLCGTLERDICMDWKVVAAIAAEICNQLSPVHALGFIAGDLTPANVVVEYKGRLPGAIRLLCEGASNNDGTLLSYKETESLFRPGMFESPEFRKKGVSSPAADVFSIGAIMYACITGTPYEGGVVGWLFREASIRKALVRFDVPEPLAGVIACCLSPDPRKRFKNAADLRLALLHPKSPRRSNRGTVNTDVRRKTVMLALGMAALSVASYLFGALPPLVEKLEKGRLTRNTYAAPGGVRTAATVQALAPKIRFDKARNEYRTGDTLALTIGPPSASYKLFLFYIDEMDNVIAIYPSRAELESHQGSFAPKVIASVGDNKMYVNAKDGKFVLVSVSDCDAGTLPEQVLSESDWSSAFPSGHALNLTGRELLARIERLQQVVPQSIAQRIEDAPKCDTHSLLSHGAAE